MAENNIQDVWDLEIESGAVGVTSLEIPVGSTTREGKDVERMSEMEENQGGGLSETAGEGEKAQRQEDVPVKEKEDAGGEGESKKRKGTETGNKRQLSAELDVEVQKGEEQGDTAAKKAKVAEEGALGKKKRQAKTQAKAKIHATETTTKKKGRGRPRKSSETKKTGVVVEGDQKETAKTIN